MRMRLSQANAVKYIEANLGKRITDRTFRRWKRYLESEKLKRLYEIGQYGFVDQHLERIDQLELIQQLMWENYHLEKNPEKKTVILERISKIQPYLSAYYEATKYVAERPQIPEPKRLSNI
jgi:hypothetical protein